MSKRVKLINKKLNFPHLRERAVFEGEVGKYETEILIDKDDKETVQNVLAAIAEAAKEAGIKVNNSMSPLRDGDEKAREKKRASEYKGRYYIKAKSDNEPGVVTKSRTEANAEYVKKWAYSGCDAHVSVSFYVPQKYKRVCVGLNNVMLLESGDRIGGELIDAASDFAEFGGDDSDFDDIDF